MASQYKHHDQAGKAAPRHGDAGTGSEGTSSPGLLRRMGTWAHFTVDAPTDFTRPDLSRVRRLVFVCSANLVRSAYAQALCAQAGIEADSFGLYTRTGLRTFTTPARVAAAMGTDIGRHRARHWYDFQPEEGDLYLVMEPDQARQLSRLGFPRRRIALLGHWSRPRRLCIRDAHGRSGAELRRCFALIHSAVDRLAREIWGTARTVPPLTGHAAAPRPAGDEARHADAPKAPLAWALAGMAAASLVDF